MYDLKFDSEARILRLRLEDFWSAEEMIQFGRELMVMVTRLGKTAPDFVILSDCRKYPVQSAEVGTGWGRLLGPDTTIKAPYAVVVGSMLNKLQAERVLLAPSLRVFLSMDEALAWLSRHQHPSANPAGERKR